MHYLFFSTGSWERNASLVRMRELGIELLNRGHAVSFLIDDVPWNHNELDVDKRANLIFVAPGSLWATSRVRRSLIRRSGADFVHVINPSLKAYLALKGQRVHVVGDWDEWPAQRRLGLARNALNWFLDSWLRRGSKPPIVCSRYLQREFSARYGLRAAYIPYATYMRTDGLSDGRSPFTEPTVVYMGNFHPAYDHDLILDAAVILKRDGFEPRIELLGEGPDLEKTRRLVRDCGLGNVHLPGFCRGENLWRKLRHAHGLLFPIRQTILNLCRCPSKTFSYAQARRPIVTNRVGEVAEVLEDRATYVGATPQAFAKAIREVLAQPPREVDYAVERHNWSARADALLDELECA